LKTLKLVYSSTWSWVI